MRRLRRLCATFACALSSFPAGVSAADVKLSGFATAGYAVSNQDFRYLRYIDNDGTLKADSLAGVQAEAQLNPQWGATLQMVASAPRTRDEGIETKIRWAFISFRPNNEWLFRVGRLRPPVLINTQNAEVGVTYDQARLPVEVYSLSPVYDADGGAVTKTWLLENSEFNLDAYWGKSDIKFRFPFQRAAPQRYIAEKITFKGVVLTHASTSLLLRGGYHHAALRPGDQERLADTYTATPFPAPPPFGGTVFQPANFLDRIDASVLTLGADWRWGDWRVTGEYGQRFDDDNTGALTGVERKSGYVTVARNIGKWTPYVSHARLLAGSETRALYQRVNATPVPLGAQGPPLFLPANYHRTLADQVLVYDQYSTMLGASYSFSQTSKLKFEWMRTKVGVLSAFVDGDISDKAFNVFSVSYSVAF